MRPACGMRILRMKPLAANVVLFFAITSALSSKGSVEGSLAGLSLDPIIGNWSGLAIDVRLGTFECLQIRRGRLKFSLLGLKVLIHLQELLGFFCSEFSEYDLEAEVFKGYSGFVNYMHTCSKAGLSGDCKCDIGIGAWVASSERLAAVDLVTPFTNDDMRVMTTVAKATGAGYGRFSFLSTFSWSVWLALLVVVVLHVCITALDPAYVAVETSRADLAYENDTSTHRFKVWLMKNPVLFKLRRAVFDSLYHILGQAPHFFSENKRGSKEKAMGIMALCMGVFLVTVFQASLAVKVILSSPNAEFMSVNDFETCRIPADRVVVLNNSGAQTFWMRAISRTRCHRSPGAKVPGLARTMDEAFEGVLSGKYDYLYSLSGQIDWATTGKYCGKLVAVGDGFFQNSVGYVLPKNSNLTVPFSKATLQLLEMDKLLSITEYVRKRQNCSPLSNPTLGWGMLGPFFYLAFGAEAIMLVVMLVDRKPLRSDEALGTSMRQADADGT